MIKNIDIFIMEQLIIKYSIILKAVQVMKEKKILIFKKLNLFYTGMYLVREICQTIFFIPPGIFLQSFDIIDQSALV